MCETTSRGRRTVKIPTIQRFRAVRAPSHHRTLRGRTWNRHRSSSSRVKAERGFINNSLCVSSHCGDFLQTYTHSCLYIYLGCGKDSSIFFLSRPKPTIYSISLHVFCVCTEKKSLINISAFQYWLFTEFSLQTARYETSAEKDASDSIYNYWLPREV